VTGQVRPKLWCSSTQPKNTISGLWALVHPQRLIQSLSKRSRNCGVEHVAIFREFNSMNSDLRDHLLLVKLMIDDEILEDLIDECNFTTDGRSI